jgi:hypothetical protein
MLIPSISKKKPAGRSARASARAVNEHQTKQRAKPILLPAVVVIGGQTFHSCGSLPLSLEKMTSATTSLSFRHMFGINGLVADNIAFADDDTIVYIVGHNVVLYNKTEKKQRFIYGSEASDGMTSFAVSPGKRYIAVAERGDRGAQVNVFDLKSYRKRKNLINTESTSKVSCSALPHPPLPSSSPLLTSPL